MPPRIQTSCLRLAVVGRVTLELETSETRETRRAVDGRRVRRTDAEERRQRRIGLVAGRRIRLASRRHRVADVAAVEAIAVSADGARVAGTRAIAIGEAAAERLHRAAELLERTTGAGTFVA